VVQAWSLPDFEETDLSRKYPSCTALPPVYGDECEKLVIDYLTALKRHVDRYIKEHDGDVFFGMVPKEFIITVPLVSSDEAQNRMQACAEKAGFGNKDSIHTITELEEAAAYALDTMSNTYLNVDDTFMICDVGAR
jgi:hypothetical protein